MKQKTWKEANQRQKDALKEQALDYYKKQGVVPPPYTKQKKALTGFTKEYKTYYKKRNKQHKGLIGHGALILGATGFGKTRIAAMVIQWLLKQNKSHKTLILTHRKSIMYSLWEELFFILGIESSVMRSGTYYRFNESVTIAMVPTLYRYKHGFKKDEFELVIADEAHHSVADTWLNILSYFDSFKLGMTATADRADNKSVTSLFNNKALINVTLGEAIKAGWVSNYRFIQCHDNTDSLLEDEMYIEKKKYKKKDRDKTLFIEERVQAILNNVNKYFPEGSSAIAFAGNTKYAKYITNRLNEAGIPAEVILSEYSDSHNEEAVRRLEKGEIRVLVNLNIVSEGYNAPAVGGILFLTPVSNFATFLQRLGRALRAMLGKEEAIILDFASAHHAITKILRFISSASNTNLVSQIKLGVGQKIAVYKLGDGCTYQMDEELLPHIQEAINSRQKLTEVIKEIKNEKTARAIIKEINMMIRNGNFIKSRYPELNRLMDILKRRHATV